MVKVKKKLFTLKLFNESVKKKTRKKLLILQSKNSLKKKIGGKRKLHANLTVSFKFLQR